MNQPLRVAVAQMAECFPCFGAEAGCDIEIAPLMVFHPAAALLDQADALSHHRFTMMRIVNKPAVHRVLRISARYERGPFFRNGKIRGRQKQGAGIGEFGNCLAYNGIG